LLIGSLAGLFCWRGVAGASSLPVPGAGLGVLDFDALPELGTPGQGLLPLAGPGSVQIGGICWRSRSPGRRWPVTR